ncbi:hypothetical protein DM01DRAFT_1038015 [Hesseltinella vesiculosa]|uniref:Uncharacterized protein n=1 Tax=Hesseltinella vesiculosa TaxID=101127 RepID=A0A1X2GIK9_9FUNG|nr:hypothetical protein DM01DRAFT_1038015 [Hesseltinella vesiculosa]
MDTYHHFCFQTVSALAVIIFLFFSIGINRLLDQDNNVEDLEPFFPDPAISSFPLKKTRGPCQALPKT